MKIDRRSFLGGAGALLASELPRTVWAKRAPLAPLKLKTLEIAVGAAKPFGAVHVSDTHIVRVDKRDDERKMKLAAGRCYFRMASTIWTKPSIWHKQMGICCCIPAI